MTYSCPSEEIFGSSVLLAEGTSISASATPSTERERGGDGVEVER